MRAAAASRKPSPPVRACCDGDPAVGIRFDVASATPLREWAEAGVGPAGRLGEVRAGIAPPGLRTPPVPVRATL